MCNGSEFLTLVTPSGGIKKDTVVDSNACCKATTRLPQLRMCAVLTPQSY